METPSSTRRVTRSMATTSASAGNNSLLSKKFEESEKARQTSGKNQNKHQDRSALVDITNDSPIVGLAMGMGSLETPSSAISKKKVVNQGQYMRTPGSGEALLRGQVKTLLQRVEEEAEVSKITFEDRPFFNLQGLVRSPLNLLAPTPANTPQVLNFSDAYDPSSLTSSPVSETLLIPQMINEMFDEKKEGEDLITRSLMLDFSDKSEESESSDCSSVLTHVGVSEPRMESGKEKSSTDDDAASVWSIQVNLSSPRNDDDEDGDVEEGSNLVEEEDDCEDGEEDEDGGLLLDELCERMSKISFNKYMGKHIRFLYDSDDDEIRGEEEVSRCECPDVLSESDGGGVMHLRGMPTPKGKHLRFPQETDSC